MRIDSTLGKYEEGADDGNGVDGAPNGQRVGVTGWESDGFLRARAAGRIRGSCPLCGSTVLALDVEGVLKPLRWVALDGSLTNDIAVIVNQRVWMRLPWGQ